MKVTDTIHAVRHTFRLLVGEGRHVDRFVYSYLIVGKTICLIDTGVAATAPLILDTVRSLGRSPGEISLILLTHAHPDHIGGCAPIRRFAPAPVAIHPAERPWVEDVERQYRERPIPNLFELVPEGVPVGRELTDGEAISWEGGKTIRVVATPGHSCGSVSFFFEEEGALFSGDAVPAAGAIPIYVDPGESVASVEKLQALTGVRLLLSSWHEPLAGERIALTLEEGRRYIERIGALVREIRESEPRLSGQELSLRALERLGIAVPRVLFMVEASFTSHLRRPEEGN
jgi:glyoxylase-like metal-dependent hydrolase (beta-lactamase superfamily II)